MSSTNETPHTGSPLDMPHLLLLTLSYASPQTLGRCMAVSSFWYDAATTFLWAHISYRVNRFLTDPGVTPFLPVPSGDRFQTLRRAKRRAVRHVRVVEVRTHDCDEIVCARMSLHGATQAESEQMNGAAEREDGTEDIRMETDQEVQRVSYYRPPHVLSALRLHCDNLHKPRPIPFPCPFVAQLDTYTLVLVPIRNLSMERPLPLPSPTSLRKLVLLLIPPTQAPGEYRIADTIPPSVEDVVVYLWRRHPGSKYDSFRGAWAAQMGRMRWGPDKIWNHWCNLILASSPPTTDWSTGSHSRERRRRYTFVGTGSVDSTWLDLADNPSLVPTFPGQDAGEDPAGYGLIQEKFEEGMRKCLEAKIRAKRTRRVGEEAEAAEAWEMELKGYLDSMRFLSREDYLAEGGWEGEFTKDEVVYHG